MKLGDVEFEFFKPWISDKRFHGPKADPKNWQWWKLFHLNLVLISRCEPDKPGIRLLVYTRNHWYGFDLELRRYSNS